MLKTMLLDKSNKKLIKEIKDILINWENSNTDILDDIATITLLDDDNLIGFYRIVLHDNDNTNYAPWIANIYIKEKYRNKGNGRYLINTIPNYLEKLNISNIYLHTRINNFYEKFGWHLLESLDLHDGIKRNIYALKK